MLKTWMKRHLRKAILNTIENGDKRGVFLHNNYASRVGLRAMPLLEMPKSIPIPDSSVLVLITALFFVS